MYAEAANELGNIADAVAPLNQIMQAEGKVDIAPAGSTKEDIRNHINTLFSSCLQYEGLEYSTWIGDVGEYWMQRLETGLAISLLRTHCSRFLRQP